MKNLFICCGNLKAGGAERVISILANKFVATGINVSLYTWYKTDIFYKIDERVKIIQIPEGSNKNNFGGQMKWFRNEVKQESPDVILSFLAPFNILTVLSMIGLKIPVLVAERNDPYFVSPNHNWFWKIVRNFAYWLADGVLVQTNVNKSHFPWYIKKKSTIIYNPVTFSSDKIGEALMHEKRKEIVSVTRLEKQKNVSMLIEAFAKFQKVHPEYILTVYGEGEEREALEKKIEDMHLNQCVFLPGRKKNVHDLIVGAEIFAMASNFEGMSNSLIEAMCLGLPCISTKVSGATDLIKDGKNGLLVDLGDIEGLYRAFCRLTDNPKLEFSLGQEAQKLNDTLNVDLISKQWLDYIDQHANGVLPKN